MSHSDEIPPQIQQGLDGKLYGFKDKDLMELAELWEIETGFDNGATFPLPAWCEGCRKFEAALQTEPHDSGWRAKLVPLLSEFRLVHHHPRFAFMDRGIAYVEHMKSLYAGEQLRDLARFVAMSEAMELADGD